jgi:hypothetical protein
MHICIIKLSTNKYKKIKIVLLKEKRHLFHIVDPSPWPFLLSIGAGLPIVTSFNILFLFAV